MHYPSWKTDFTKAGNGKPYLADEYAHVRCYYGPGSRADLDPNVPAVVDTVNSSFHIEAGDYRGHMISGSVFATVPPLDLTITGACPSLQFQIDGATAQGQVALLYAFGPGSFAVPAGLPCAGTILGLDNTTRLATMLTADAAGSIVWNTNVPAGACGTAFLQVLDLSSCDTSSVVDLQ